MKRTLLPLLSVLAFGLLFSACDSADPQTEISPTAPLASDRVEIAPSLEREITLIGVSDDREKELLRVRVDLENQALTPVNFNYQFTWIDETGATVETPPALWKPGFILARERIHLTGIAPTPYVTDYRVRLMDRGTYNATEAKKKK